MHFLLSALGSAGDVHPFIAIGQALRARGHAVRIIAMAPFEARIAKAGLAFTPLGTDEDYQRLLARPDIWRPLDGARILIDELLERLPEAYETTTACVVPGDTVLVGSTMSWGLRLVQERLGLPGATVHLSPFVLPSASLPPVLPGGTDLSWVPAAGLRALQWAVERGITDPWIRPRLERLRTALGLPPVRRVLGRWMHSPELVIGAWPAWFAPPQADWPEALVTTGFPLFDEGGAPLDPALERFLAAGPAPIGITPGSAMAHGEAFFARALAACESLGRRAVLVSPFDDQLPAALSASVHHAHWAPFSRLLPRLSGLVHHGGVGTSAQALAAGLPQLVVPFAHDQFDDAARLARLGVASVQKAKAPVADWARQLRHVTGDAAVAEAARRCAARMAADGRPAMAIAERLERLGESHAVASA